MGQYQINLINRPLKLKNWLKIYIESYILKILILFYFAFCIFNLQIYYLVVLKNTM